MSNFNKIFGKPDIICDVFRAIANKQLIQFRISEDRLKCDALMDDLNPDNNLLVIHLLQELKSYRRMAHTIETFATAQILNSPKIFEPTQLSCESMEQIAINIPLCDYHQPFPMMVIELPENYIKNKIVPCPQTTVGYSGKPYDPEHYPTLVGVYFDENLKLMIVVVYFSSGQVVNRFFWHREEEPITIEEEISPTHVLDLPDSLTINKEEREVASNAMRVGINACLLLMEYGCKSLGPKNKSWAARLERYIEKAKKEKDVKKLEQNIKELNSLPIYYDFEQHVDLYESTIDESTPVHTIGERSSPIPHWRRGHWTQQPYGPKQSLRKRILRKPKLINAHLLQQGALIKTIYKQK